mgnify:FL=1
MSEIMKAVASMQSSMQTTQETLENERLTGTAGLTSDQADIKITINGRFKCISCNVSDQFQEQDNPIMEQLIINALNGAVDQVGAITRKQIESLSKGLKDNQE